MEGSNLHWVQYIVCFSHIRFLWNVLTASLFCINCCIMYATLIPVSQLCLWYFYHIDIWPMDHVFTFCLLASWSFETSINDFILPILCNNCAIQTSLHGRVRKKKKVWNTFYQPFLKFTLLHITTTGQNKFMIFMFWRVALEISFSYQTCFYLVDCIEINLNTDT